MVENLTTEIVFRSPESKAVKRTRGAKRLAGFRGFRLTKRVSRVLGFEGFIVHVAHWQRCAGKKTGVTEIVVDVQECSHDVWGGAEQPGTRLGVLFLNRIKDALLKLSNGRKFTIKNHGLIYRSAVTIFGEELTRGTTWCAMFLIKQRMHC
jgi:hypothetical protein